MNDMPSEVGGGPATYHIMLRASGAADFRRAGSVRLEAQPPRGSVIEVDCDGRKLRGFVEAIFIPPGCEENCIGTLFLAEA
ncbi:MAG TPA: hypothetical protein VN656_16385 [Stellaceae bacterium]|jgi:hypothetical protein|nr:hypothetical protein [Stellaceae bacterium]